MLKRLWKPDKTCSFVLCFCALACLDAHCQQHIIAPAQADEDRIIFLQSPTTNIPVTFYFRTYMNFDTNIEDFARAGIKHPRTPLQFRGDSPYYAANQTAEIGLVHGMWGASYSRASADYYSGNRDGAQLYLNSLSPGFDPGAVTYNPDVNLNRTDVERYRFRYDTPITIEGRRSVLSLAASFLRFRRVQSGTLTGATVNTQFHGNIYLNTTLGLQPGELNSIGTSLDVAISTPVGSRGRLMLSIDNLVGGVWQRNVQHISSTVATNTLVPNGDGFLQDVPVLSGKVTVSPEQATLMMRAYLAASYTYRPCSWIAILSHDIDWRLKLGATRLLGNGIKVWALVAPSPFEWQLGANIKGLSLTIGLSSIDIGTSRRANILLGYRLKL